METAGSKRGRAVERREESRCDDAKDFRCETEMGIEANTLVVASGRLTDLMCPPRDLAWHSADRHFNYTVYEVLVDGFIDGRIQVC